jgi:hypothetical protein
MAFAELHLWQYRMSWNAVEEEIDALAMASLAFSPLSEKA